MTERIKFLDGTRGLAAFFVLIHHIGLSLDDHLNLDIDPFIPCLYTHLNCGVPIFFVLSGFVIAYSTKNKLISLSYFGTFVAKRSLRLDPPYWMGMTLIFIINMLRTKNTPDFPPAYELLINAFYLQDLLKMDRVLAVSWTLCLEIQFYLFFLGIVFLMQRVKNIFNRKSSGFTKLELSIFQCVFAFSIISITNLSPIGYIHGVFIFMWYSFAIGVLCCWSWLDLIPRWFFIGNCLSILAIGCYYGNAMLIESAITSFIFYLAFQLKKEQEWLSSKLMQYLGRISYSLYLVHLTIISHTHAVLQRHWPHSVKDVWSTLFFVVVQIILCIILSHIFYLVVEKPSIEFSKFLFRKRKPVVTVS